MNNLACWCFLIFIAGGVAAMGVRVAAEDLPAIQHARQVEAVNEIIVREGRDAM